MATGTERRGSESSAFLARWRAEFPDEELRTEVYDSLIDLGHVRVGLNISGLRHAAAEPPAGQVVRGRPQTASTGVFRCTSSNLRLWTERGTLLRRMARRGGIPCK